MINIIAFPNDTHILTVVSGVLGALFLGESISYPFDRVHTKMLAREYPKTSGFNIMREIIKAEGIRGLFRGFSVGVGNGLTKGFSQYYIFNILYNKYAYRHIVTQKEKKKQSSNPYLKYIDLRYKKTLACIFLATTASCIFSEPKNVLKLKIQGDALGNKMMRQFDHIEEIAIYHGKTILRGGFLRRLCFENLKFIGEIALFQFFLIKYDFIFNNLHNGASGTNTNLLLPMSFAAISSSAVNTLFYPLNLLQRKLVIRRLRGIRSLNILIHPLYIFKNGGIASFYRGALNYSMKSMARNTLQIGILWQITGDLRKKELLEYY